MQHVDFYLIWLTCLITMFELLQPLSHNIYSHRKYGSVGYQDITHLHLARCHGNYPALLCNTNKHSKWTRSWTKQKQTVWFIQLVLVGQQTDNRHNSHILTLSQQIKMLNVFITMAVGRRVTFQLCSQCKNYCQAMNFVINHLFQELNWCHKSCKLFLNKMSSWFFCLFTECSWMKWLAASSWDDFLPFLGGGCGNMYGNNSKAYSISFSMANAYKNK